ncbi:MAG TPA: polyprenyl synthetase family protein [Longimicrobiales bacterium]|nr:polyprenyl synthetase family protein [Longimicrobiales bacterium]
MSLPARWLDRSVPSGFAEFAAYVRPAIDDALVAAATDVPGPLGPVRDAVATALGVRQRAGRRWRPLLTLATTRAIGGSVDDALDAAIAVELTHTASLVLDDLPCMDDSSERRGVPATHRLLGSSGAILVAVGLLAQAAERLGRSPDGAALSAAWGRVFGFEGMSGGQAVDIAMGGDCRGPTRRLYRRKTTALAAFAVEAGARVAGAPAPARETLIRFGRDIGWAYQLVDDAHDLEEDRANGRAPGGRRPLRQGQRILRRGLQRVDEVDGLAEGGALLLGDVAREIVRVPGGQPIHPTSETC